ncbi:MAG: glycosyltransferase family 2 protein [Desulfobacterales bacterium]|nr:glycosyltransferase family 2 protein [Desulfobacterales bacterium]
MILNKKINCNPLVSFIIVAYNSKDTIINCLEAIKNQSIKNFEVIIFDNASSDDTICLIKNFVNNFWGNVILIESKKNIGFASANNKGALAAKGKWLIFLNPDAFPEKTYLYELLLASQQYKSFDFFASCQIQFRNKDILDGTGDIYFTNGAAKRRNFLTPLKLGNTKNEEIFGSCGASFFINRRAFFDVEGFDEDYFCYFEDVDLSLRLRLAGYKCMYIANAIVYHVGGSASGGEESDFTIYYGYRNLVWTFFKSMPLKLMIKYLLSHIMLNIRQIIGFYRRGKKKPILKAKIDGFLYLWKIIFIKRPKVQKKNRISAKNLNNILTKP